MNLSRTPDSPASSPDWKQDLADGEAFLAVGNGEQAHRAAERLSRHGILHPVILVFMLRAAATANITIHADALAKRLRLVSDPPEARVVSASWFQTLAVRAFLEGKTKDAGAYLQECLSIAPSQREFYLGDGRIAGLLPAFAEHERSKDPSVIPPPPPKPDGGPSSRWPRKPSTGRKN